MKPTSPTPERRELLGALNPRKLILRLLDINEKPASNEPVKTRRSLEDLLNTPVGRGPVIIGVAAAPAILVAATHEALAKPTAPKKGTIAFVKSEMEKMGYRIVEKGVEIVEIKAVEKGGLNIEFKIAMHSFGTLFEVPFSNAIFVQTKRDGTITDMMVVESNLSGPCVTPEKLDNESTCIHGQITKGESRDHLLDIKSGSKWTGLFMQKKREEQAECKAKPKLDLPPLAQKRPEVGDIMVVKYGTNEAPQIGYKKIIAKGQNGFTLTRINSQESDSLSYGPDLRTSATGMMEGEQFLKQLDAVERFDIVGILAPQAQNEVNGRYFGNIRTASTARTSTKTER